MLNTSALASSRVQLLEQETLYQRAMASEYYVPQRERTGLYQSGGYAPDRVFHDNPVEASIPFIENVSQQILKVDDDLIFMKPFSPCHLFSLTGTGLGIWDSAEPQEEEQFADIWTSIFFAAVTHTVKVWEAHRDLLVRRPGDGRDYFKDCDGHGPYYRPFHTPQITDVQTVLSLGRQLPVEISATLDSGMRFPYMLDVVGLHHSILAERSRCARRQTWPRSRSASAVRLSLTENAWLVNDRFEFDRDLVPPGKTWIYEELFSDKTGDAWRSFTTTLLKDKPSTLPFMLSIQDNFDVEDGLAPEFDCHKERWLTTFLKNASSSEDPSKPPSRCRGHGLAS